MTQANRPSPTPAADAATLIRPRVLIADDCDGTREVVAKMLGDGYESVVLDNGTSAWERIEADASIAALITDIEMPGLNGYELMERVRQSGDARVRALPIIAITGSVDNETRRRAFVCGVTGLVTKPIDSAQLLALAHAYIRPQTAAASPTPTTALPDPMPIAANTATPAQAESSASVDFAAPVDEIPVLQRDSSRQQDSAAAAIAPTFPVELIGVDAALQAIDAGKADLLLPFLSVLEQRLQPLLACRAARR